MAILPPNKQSNQAGSGFTNLQRVLQANRQNRLGQTVNQGVQQAGTAARGAINTAGQQFKQGVEAEKNRLGAEGQRVDRVLGSLDNVNDEDTKAFEQIRGAQAKGPTNIQNADEVKSKAQEAEELGKAGGSEGGRFGLLQRFIGGNKQYTGGQQRLDGLLLGQTGANDLRQARVGTLGLGNQANTQVAAAQAQGQELKGQAQQLKEATINKLRGSATSYDAAMAAQLEAQKAEREAKVQGVVAPMDNKALEVEADTLNQLATASNDYLNDGRSLYNVNLGDFVKQNLMNANKQAAQKDTDFTRVSNLSKLAGEDLGEEGNALLQSYTSDPSQVGKFLKSNLFQVDNVGALADKVNSSKASYDEGKASADYQKFLATRFLGGAQPGVYQVTGGYMGDLMNAYGQDQGDKFNSNVQQELNRLQQNNNGTPEQRQQLDWLQSIKSGGAQNVINNPEAAKYLSTLGYNDPGLMNQILGRALSNDSHAGSQYMENVWTPYQAQTDAAKAWASANGRGDLLSNITREESNLKAAEQKGADLGNEFKLLRSLKKKAP